jgi:hypothetical protein
MGSAAAPAVVRCALVPPPSTTPMIGTLVLTNNQIQFTITGITAILSGEVCAMKLSSGFI